jgi:hypothetical protein
LKLLKKKNARRRINEIGAPASGIGARRASLDAPAQTISKPEFRLDAARRATVFISRGGKKCQTKLFTKLFTGAGRIPGVLGRAFCSSAPIRRRRGSAALPATTRHTDSESERPAGLELKIETGLD